MGLVDRLKQLVSGPDEEGVVLECPSCGATFDTARERCPECGAGELRERGSFQTRPDDEVG